VGEKVERGSGPSSSPSAGADICPHGTRPHEEEERDAQCPIQSERTAKPGRARGWRAGAGGEDRTLGTHGGSMWSRRG
jgi:hypothetical protein